MALVVSGMGNVLLCKWKTRPSFESCVYECRVLSGMHARRINRNRGLRVPRYGWDEITAGERVRERLIDRHHRAAERHAWWKRIHK